ncbi:MAG TPA: EVE domain-containing protein [Myxococcales bacterium]
MKYWLLKTEPSAYSFDDLLRDGTTLWSGVRNYQARNFLRDEMKRGDRALIYHSSADPTAVIGVAEVVREGHPEPGETDWFQVELKALQKLPRPVTLAEIRKTPALKDMLLIRRGMRLSVQPVTKAQYDAILKLGE